MQIQKDCKTPGHTEDEGVMISLKNSHIEISPIDELIKRAQKKVRKYLQPETDLVEMLFNERKE